MPNHAAAHTAPNKIDANGRAYWRSDVEADAFDGALAYVWLNYAEMVPDVEACILLVASGRTRRLGHVLTGETVTGEFGCPEPGYEWRDLSGLPVGSDLADALDAAAEQRGAFEDLCREADRRMGDPYP
jgi:hypothetical protein